MKEEEYTHFKPTGVVTQILAKAINNRTGEEVFILKTSDSNSYVLPLEAAESIHRQLIDDAKSDMGVR